MLISCAERCPTSSCSSTCIKNGVPYTIKEAGVFFILNDLEQSVVYKLDEIITKYE